MQATTINPRGRCRSIALLFLAPVLLVTGCQTTGPRLIRDHSTPFVANNAALIHASAEQELSEATAKMRDGEYSVVIPHLTSIVSQYPDTDAGVEARYFLGLTYYKIDGLYDAEKYFRRYLELAPSGKYAALSREYLANIEATIDRHHADRASLEARVAKYEDVSEPEALAAHLELADDYWNNTEYEKAGALYTKILRIWPSFEDDSIIRRRMERGPDGNLVVLTPDVVERRYADANPLRIFNTESWRSRPNRASYYTVPDQSYNVSGQVINRADHALRDVQVIVTIFGFGSRVYDTYTYTIGRMNPGETRAFSARFTNFDNIENVHRYECTSTYLR